MAPFITHFKQIAYKLFSILALVTILNDQSPARRSYANFNFIDTVILLTWSTDHTEVKSQHAMKGHLRSFRVTTERGFLSSDVCRLAACYFRCFAE